MASSGIAFGACMCALAVIAGAFGAHGLKDHLDSHGLALWETAARYFIYGGFGLVLIGLTALQHPQRGLDIAAWGLLFGSLIFSGTVAVLALGGPRWLGAITPIGGLLMILGFVAFGWTAWRSLGS